jgi:glycosyltransferase involved in cell wall biosynthesis
VRLLFINQQLGYAGTSSYTLDLAVALRNMGAEIQIVTEGGPLRGVFVDLGFDSYQVKFNPLSFRKFLQFLREFNPELIHVQNQSSAHLGQRISRKLRVPHVVTVHRTPEPSSPQLMDPLLLGLIATNEVIRESLVNDRGIPKSLIRVIHRGVDTELLSPDSTSGRQTTEGALIPVIGFVGRLARVKGQHVFLQAARRVLDLGIDAMFAIVGEGEEERALRKLAMTLDLESNVTFSPHMPNRRELYRTFDIVIVPTLKAGVGSCALEAMSMGKPVIASAVGELLHIIEDGKTGLLVPEGDEEALAAGMVELIRNPDLSRALGSQARDRITAQFALTPMVKSTQQFYEEIRGDLEERGYESLGVARG